MFELNLVMFMIVLVVFNCAMWCLMYGIAHSMMKSLFIRWLCWQGQMLRAKFRAGDERGLSLPIRLFGGALELATVYFAFTFILTNSCVLLLVARFTIFR